MQSSLAPIPMTSHTDTKTPRCIGIIMDGNRRWAREQGLPALAGHERGFEKLKEVMRWGKARGIPHLVVYAFSTENWNRQKDEIEYLMNLIRRVFAPGARDLEELKVEGCRLHFVGDRARFAPDIRDALRNAEEETAPGAHHLWVCLSYGGRAELLHAAAEFQKSGETVTEASFAKHLWTAGMPDPDIIVRTSGEKRLSGFLPWQGVYSELFFVESYWPAFTEVEFDEVLAEYALRERRHGK